MIEFVVTDAEAIYYKLLSARAGIGEAKDLISQLTGKPKTEIKVDRAVEFSRYGLDTIVLPEPLGSVYIEFRSDGKYYAGDARVEVPYETRDSYLKKVQDILVSEGALRASDGVLILSGGDTPLFMVKKYIGHGIDLSFGQGGTERRKLTTLENFEMDIGNFMKTLGKCVNLGYDNPPTLKLHVYI